MTRGRTAPQIAADVDTSSGSATLIELLFDSGALRLVDAQWPIVADGNTYVAGGGALSIKPHEETADGPVGADMSLAGLDAGIKALVFAEPYHGRIARLLTQAFDENDVPVGTPAVDYVGRIRALSVTENPQDRTVTVTCETEHFDAEFEDPADLRNTDAEQRRRYPTDLGCEHLASLVDRVITRKPKT